MLFAGLGATLTAQTAGAQRPAARMPSPLPETFTIVYTVVSKDVRTEAMRKSEQQSLREYWLRQVTRGSLSKEEAARAITQDERIFKEATPTVEYRLTLSCDGNHLLCLTKSADGKDMTLGIYAVGPDKTYYLRPQTDGNLPVAYKGFNYSALRCIPLLPYAIPKMNLFFLKDAKEKDAKEQPSASAAASVGTWTMQGDIPITRSQFTRDAQVPYGPADVTLARVNNRIEVQKCVEYYRSDKAIADDWVYSQYETKLETRLPGQIVHQDYNTFFLNGIKQTLPKTRFGYALVSASVTPLDAERFDMHTWYNEALEALEARRDADTAPKPKNK